jgi:hypothetical protein
VADLYEAQRLLGYYPRVPLADGLQRLLREDPRFTALLAGRANGGAKPRPANQETRAG